MVASVSKTFTATIICEVQTLTISTSPPALTTVQVGIDAQPVTISFAVTQAPECLKTIAFTHTPTPPTFVTLSSITATGGNVEVNGATIADHNTYSLVLTATVAEDSQSVTSNFDVFIKDPCSTATFQPPTPSPLVDM